MTPFVIPTFLRQETNNFEFWIRNKRNCKTQFFRYDSASELSPKASVPVCKEHLPNGLANASIRPCRDGITEIVNVTSQCTAYKEVCHSDCRCVRHMSYNEEEQRFAYECPAFLDNKNKSVCMSDNVAHLQKYESIKYMRRVDGHTSEKAFAVRYINNAHS